MVIDHTRIRDFWMWFAAHCQTFGSQFEFQSQLDELDRRVEELGPYGWELGPDQGRSDGCFLAISPGGDPELLRETMQIIDLAPQCPGWRFLPALPPKDWDFHFIFRDVSLDATQWQYTLYRRPHKMFDAVIRADDLRQLEDESRRAEAAEFAVTSALGELLRIQRIAIVEVCGAGASGGKPLPLLARHLSEL